MKNIFSFLLLFFTMLVGSKPAFANHVMINCGPQGYWSDKDSANGGYFVWLMSDDIAQIQQEHGNQPWKAYGKVEFNAKSSVRDIALVDYKEQDQFRNKDFSLTLIREFSRPRQKKDRRFFEAKFQTKDAEGEVECSFGSK